MSLINGRVAFICSAASLQSYNGANEPSAYFEDIQAVLSIIALESSKDAGFSLEALGNFSNKN